MTTARALDLSRNEAWTNHEAVTAHLDTKLARALALDAEIRARVGCKRRDVYELCLLLGRMRREELWEPLGKRSFPRYAVEVGAAGSTREARQWANVADKLPQLPEIHAVFRRGAAEPSQVREAAPAATPETDAEWARNLPHMTVDQVRSEVRRQRGEAPTARIQFEAPADDKVRLLNLIAALGRRLERRSAWRTRSRTCSGWARPTWPTVRPPSGR